MKSQSTMNAGRGVVCYLPFVLLLLLSGCGGGTVVLADRSDIADLNRRTSGRDCRVKLVSGDVHRARDLVVTQSVTTWRTPPPRRSRLPTEPQEFERRTTEIYSIAVKSRAKGARKGLLWGLVIGVGAGSIAALTTPEEQSEWRGVAVVGFGVLGTGLGTLIGTGVGSWEEYSLMGSRTSD